MELTPGNQQTKSWRKEQSWYQDGKHNECEIEQRKVVEKLTGYDCVKTNSRLNTETFEMDDVSRPLNYSNGFEWTEDFDGYSLVHHSKKFEGSCANIYFNFKFICENGGAQTRSLREVYHFIKCQLEYLLNDKYNRLFVNILDGDTSSKHMEKFKYLINKNKYISVKDNIFIGDLYSFKSWYENI
jgi:hypothetical protein